MNTIRFELKFFYSCIFLILTQSTQAQDSIPRNLDQSIVYFERLWTASEKEEFKNFSEHDAIEKIYFSTGLWIRNSWLRNKGNVELKNQFISLGVSDIDEMSVIILRSLHRKLNLHPIKLNEQIENYEKSIEPLTLCLKRQETIAVDNYERYNIGDTVKVIMEVDTSEGKNFVIVRMCPKIEWKFDAKKDLYFSGILKDKYYKKQKYNAFFELFITDINMPKAFFKGAIEKGKNFRFLIQDMTFYDASNSCY